MFFLVKKNQKTFSGLNPRQTQASQTIDKSFLLLFFKKEALAFPCPPP
jgi:hypothetical protein